MISKQKNKKHLKVLSGILVPSAFETKSELSFLTSNGIYYRVSKNNKYNQLKSNLGECLSVVGQISNTNSGPIIEIFSYIGEFDNSFISDNDDDDFNSPQGLIQNASIDYDLMYT